MMKMYCRQESNLAYLNAVLTVSKPSLPIGITVPVLVSNSKQFGGVNRTPCAKS